MLFKLRQKIVLWREKIVAALLRFRTSVSYFFFVSLFMHKNSNLNHIHYSLLAPTTYPFAAKTPRHFTCTWNLIVHLGEKFFTSSSSERVSLDRISKKKKTKTKRNTKVAQETAEIVRRGGRICDFLVNCRHSCKTICVSLEINFLANLPIVSIAIVFKCYLQNAIRYSKKFCYYTRRICGKSSCDWCSFSHLSKVVV